MLVSATRPSFSDETTAVRFCTRLCSSFTYGNISEVTGCMLMYNNDVEILLLYQDTYNNNTNDGSVK